MSKHLPATAPEFFSDIHTTYDSLIHRCVPRYDEMLDCLIHYLPVSPGQILELGCGTGNLTRRLVERFPSASIVTVDASPEMAAAARDLVGGRVTPIVSRFEDLAFDGKGFDLIVSSISLHHVADKGALYSMLNQWLGKGGEFWFSDQCAGATERTHDRNWADWLTFCRREGGCTEDEIKDLLDHAAAHDHYTPVPEHFRLLARAGFEEGSIDCVWRNLIWAIIGAQRP